MYYIKNSIYSIGLSILSIILVTLTYSIDVGTMKNGKTVVLIFLILSIISIIACIIFGIMGIKHHEKGILKYIGISLLILITLVVLIMPIIVGIIGFNTP